MALGLSGPQPVLVCRPDKTHGVAIRQQCRCLMALRLSGLHPVLVCRPDKTHGVAIRRNGVLADKLMETVFFARINAGLHFCPILPYGGTHVARFGKEIFGEFGNMAAGNAKRVVHHQD